MYPESNRSYLPSNQQYLPEEYRTLFLGDLSIHCTRQDILQMFSPFGAIERITLKVGVAMTGLGYGFISFTDADSAERAMQSLQGAILLGRAVRIKWATPRGQPNMVKYEPEYKTQQTAEVHFSFMTKDIHHVVTEEVIRRQYEQFGEIIDIVIKRSKIDPNIPLQNGYGFVRYRFTTEGLHAAINAKKFMHQVQAGGIHYDTHFTHALESYLQREYPELLTELNPHRSVQQQYYQQPQQQPNNLAVYRHYSSHPEESFPSPPHQNNYARNVSPLSMDRSFHSSNSWQQEKLMTYPNPSSGILSEGWMQNTTVVNSLVITPPDHMSIATSQSSNSNLPTVPREDREAFSTYYTPRP